MATLPAPDAVPQRDLLSIKRAICERARDFDIAPLLDLLATLGYRPGDVEFRGHLTEAPQPTLVEHVAFADLDAEIDDADPRPAIHPGSIAELGAESARPAARASRAAHAGGAPAQVTVTVNLGLLSCRSPLPSYFQHLLRDASIRDPLVELLRIIDRNLLRTRLTCGRPEHIVSHWNEMSRDLLRIHSLDSLVGLSWLFRHVFPELPAVVERTSEQLRVPYASARLGFSDLGSVCLGATTRIDVHDFQVTLHCEDAVLRPGVPWLHEVDRRLRTVVFPALDPVCMNLTVVLMLADDHAVAMLRDDRGAQRDSYLGIDPLAVPGAALPPRRVVMYSGLLPHDHPDTDQLESELSELTRITVTPSNAAGRAPTAPGGDDRDDGDGELDHRGELDLMIELGGRVHRYQAVVRWGIRAWYRDEPYAIALTCDQLPQPAPTAQHQPRLWRLLRDQARRLLAAELATATLAHYGASGVTDPIVADLLARGQHAALHALLGDGAASDVPREAWERYVQAQP